MKKERILIVDDEVNLRNLIRIYLARDYDVTEAKDGREAISLLQQSSYDLLILDIMMPDMDGWEVCKKVRSFSMIPILMLTARTDVKDRVFGLQIGADDYLVKPFDAEELLARVNALLRRATVYSGDPSANAIVSFHELEIDQEGRTVRVKGKEVNLTPTEFDLLALMALHRKKVYTRDDLIDHIWGIDDFKGERAIDTHVKNLRFKLKEAGLSYNPIRTVWGVGYQFQTVTEGTS